MYEYLDRPPQVGDVVERVRTDNTSAKIGTIGIVGQPDPDSQYKGLINTDSNYWKVIKTKPYPQMKAGDHFIITVDGKYPVGTVHTAYYDFGKGKYDGNLYYDGKNSIPSSEAVVLCKEELKEQNSVQEIVEPNKTIKENKMTFTQLINKIFGEELTDYEKRPNYMVIAFNRDGSEKAITSAESIEQVTEAVQSNPELWGCKLVTYKMGKEVFTDVPVTVAKSVK